MIDEIILTFDSNNEVIPPEVFVSEGSKNYISRIIGHHKKYKWNRQWLSKNQKYNGGRYLLRYERGSFEVGQVYEFHASFPKDSNQETDNRKAAFNEKYSWKAERESRHFSKYNGFWKCISIDKEGIKMERVYEGDMGLLFPKSNINKSQTQIGDFMSENNHVI